MPLPNVRSGTASQCEARSRSADRRCLNPAAFGMRTCRYHGARRVNTVLHGTDHPQYKHGLETKDAKAKRAAKLLELRLLFSAIRGT